MTHLSDSYIAHKLVTLEAQLARYEVIGTVEQIRAVIKAGKRISSGSLDGHPHAELNTALDALDGGKK